MLTLLTDEADMNNPLLAPAIRQTPFSHGAGVRLDAGSNMTIVA